MTIYRQGNPWYTTVMPVGGNQLTGDLAAAIQTPFYVAEDLKVKWGQALPELVDAGEEVVIPSFQGQPRRIVRRRSLAGPLQARLVEMVKLILLRARQAGLRQVPTGGIVLTGGASELPGMKELVQKVVGGPVRVAYPRGIAGLPTQLQKPTFSATVGLLLWGIKHQGERRIYSNAQRTLWGNKSKSWQFLRGKGNKAKVPVG